jgi:hypothetical protein
VPWDIWLDVSSRNARLTPLEILKSLRAGQKVVSNLICSSLP